MTQEGIYWDPSAREGEGAQISTHSMVKTFRRCPKQAEFKYIHRLQPRLLGAPLKRGTWVHMLLEDYHNGDDWLATHKKLSAQFAEMMDEEKDFYGDMPTEIYAVMRSYIWHYKNDPWKAVETEFQLEAELPDGSLYRGKVDALMETPFGLYLVDHKTHKTLPNMDFRVLDPQSLMYLWAAEQNGLKVEGFIWNYLRWKAPSTPKAVYGNSRLSDSACDTDYPTFVTAIQQYKLDYPETFKLRKKDIDLAKSLKATRYKWGEPQTSTFFRRDVIEKSPEMIERGVREFSRTAGRMHSYDFITDPTSVERVVDRGCSFSCSYTDLCTADLTGRNIRPLIKQNYITKDPQYYYEDRPKGENVKSED